VECGPGKVLTGLNRRIHREGGVQFQSLDNPDAVDTAIKVTGGSADARE
jgi:hypothetical protein